MKSYYCFVCNRNTPTELKETAITVKIRENDITYQKSERYCLACQNLIFDEVLVNRELHHIYQVYLEHYHLDFSSFFKIRKSYSLSKKMFARVVGWGNETVDQYEKLMLFPSDEHLGVYEKLNRNFYFILELLESKRDSFTKKEYETIFNKVKSSTQYYFQKLKQMILYFLEDNLLTMTQLMKYLFFGDFLAKKELGSSITEYNYIHLPHGPALEDYEKLVFEIAKQEKIGFNEYISHKRVCLQFYGNSRPNFIFFSNEEILIMKRVKKMLEGKSTHQLSELSHQFIGWKKTKLNEIIDYEYAKYL